MPSTLRLRDPAPPEAIDTHTDLKGLRAVAIFEAAKGSLVILAATGLLTMLHRDVGAIAEDLVRRLHLNPDHHVPHAFVQAAHHMTDARLWAIAGGAVAYATVRFIEAYGLWHALVWAEWFALLSGLLYLPWEIYNIIVRPSPLHFGVLAINVAIVLYMIYIRVRASWFCGPDVKPVPDQ